MKYLLFLVLSLTLFACHQRTDNIPILQNRIDSLERKVADSYKPGLGEFMVGIQTHHAKLWFAGQSKNWKLAHFEIHEIMESIEDIQKYQAGRKEAAMIGMLNPALDSLSMAVQQQNAALFKSSYLLLTNTCNNCHRANNFEFNAVKIPDFPAFSNQDFRVHESK